MKAFKVVRNQVDGLKSTNTKHQIKYLENKWVTPTIPNSKLLCFDLLDNAISFMTRENLNYEIWECDIAECEPINKLDSFNDFAKFWLGRTGLYSEMISPKGTIGTSAVKLTKKLYPYYKVVKLPYTSFGHMFISARIGNVEYSYGRWTYAPQGTKLFVFDQHVDAKEFKGLDEFIFKCAITNPETGYGCRDVRLIDKFWSERADYLKKHGSMDGYVSSFASYANPEAVLVDSVKLIYELCGPMLV